jgi:hypothetical protein
VSSQLHAPAALLPAKEPTISTGQEAMWVPQQVWAPWRREKSCRCLESNPGRPACSPSLYRLSYPAKTKCNAYTSLPPGSIKPTTSTGFQISLFFGLNTQSLESFQCRVGEVKFEPRRLSVATELPELF